MRIFHFLEKAARLKSSLALHRSRSTRKFTLLVSVPLGVTTWTGPVVAPVGTVVVISGARDDFEHRRGAVERDAGRAGQIGPENLNVTAHLARGGQRFHKRAQAHRQAEDRAAAE